MDGYKGIDYLRKKLDEKRVRVRLRYEHYEMKNVVLDLNISTPPDLRFWMGTLGWCSKAVDSMADRLVFREFEDDNLGMGEVFQMNNQDVLIDSAILGALISACDFVYVTKDNDGTRLQVIDGSNATGIMDTNTMMLKEGYAVLDRDTLGVPTMEAHFTREATVIYRNGKLDSIFNNPAPYPLLIPMVNRPDAKRPFGHSRISRACMSIVGAAIRTAKRSEIAAEFYSYPQKYATGLSEDAEKMDKWKAAMSTMIVFEKDEDGDKPTLGQFQQASMSPHSEQMRMWAGLFAGETGLTLDDLGFPSQNPSSAEAIKSSHETLRLMARKAQRDFSIGLLNTGYIAACVRDDIEYRREMIGLTRVKWEPVFEPDAAMLSVIGDGAIKINQSVPGFFGENNLRDLTGIEANV
jgi:hypothetical protein